MGAVGKAEYGRRWRDLNQSYVQNYNAERRQEVVKVRCLGCAELFERPSAARHVYCSHECAKLGRRERERRLRDGAA
jgi:hypothetical protein